ncbi:MAG: selenide, water dikinase SelD [Thermoanaerobaculia bacterium]
MSPVGLGELLAGLPRNTDPNLLVGFATSDDAAVYRLGDDQAVVTTADIITPPVDDPYLFGQIAAANALSDVFAMGARPVVCLNLVGFPSAKLEPEILHQMVAGALSKVTEAGAVLGGGHTTEDDEPKYGLAVTGLVHPDEVWTNAGARPGDALVLTKPIGSGVLFNANLKGWISKQALDACLEILITLNRTAAEVLRGFSPHAVTDVTGFGLAGHGLEMARGAGVSLRIDVEAVPVMDEALASYERGMTTGVNQVNRELVESATRFERELPRWHQEIFIDPQTSGGLLAAVPGDRADDLVAALHQAGVVHARRIGAVEPFAGEHHLFFV